MNLSQKVAFNTLVQVLSKVATVVFGLLTTILLTGYLGREGYGDYMYVITLVIMFGALSDWGTAVIGVREASKAKEGQGRILGNVFLLRLGLTLMAAFLLVLTAFFLPLQTSQPLLLQQAIILGTLILILFATKASLGIVFQTKLVMHNLAAADIAASALIFLISWLFIRQGLGLLPLIGAVILANVLAVMIAWILVRRTIKLVFRVDKVLVKKLVKESLPMGAVLLVFTIDNKIDTVMLGSIEGSGAVGIYAVAYRVYDVLVLGAAYLMNSLLPVISQYGDLNRWGMRLKQIYQKAFDVLLLMGTAVFVGTWFLAPVMVRIITQQRFLEFLDAVFVLRILSLALFLAYFNHLTGYTIVALGRQRPYLFIALTTLVFNVSANLFVIPRFSYYGAAMVTVLTEALVLVITTLFIFRLIKIFPSLTHFPKTVYQLVGLIKKKKGRS